MKISNNNYKIAHMKLDKRTNKLGIIILMLKRNYEEDIL